MAVTTTSTTKAPTHTILGAISAVGVINLNIRIPRQSPKVRKIQGVNFWMSCHFLDKIGWSYMDRLAIVSYSL
ncbi:hypothetical protein BDF20DRAFT_923852 [Mycotypha africana]|uniref:uncharacterized protein n=1 Tax=Mycotypha africana TaxID=64632 RepID=UPI0023002E25|nr:uncharacterized protein BDF20DRAFT_923852 [Mycotypha africana]KAI8968871.1 hypothetical protein BDF20DRAFT_923852 [Mycotypha africana]